MALRCESMYDVLGVPETASERDVKRAYRALSMEHHPDRNAGKKDTTAAFQRIGEAYATLADPELRRQHDLDLHASPAPNMDMNVVDIQELFGMMFAGGGRADMFFAGDARGFGFGAHPGMFSIPTIVISARISLAQSYAGCSVPITVVRWVEQGGARVSETELAEVRFPPGIGDGDAVIMSGFGNAIGERARGDVRIEARVEADPVFSRRGPDLVLLKRLSLREALCGFSFSERHPCGKTVSIGNLEAPAVICPGYTRVIPGMGMPHTGGAGNMVVEFAVDFPTRLSKAQVAAIAAALAPQEGGAAEGGAAEGGAV